MLILALTRLHVQHRLGREVTRTLLERVGLRRAAGAG
jgi:hypothetical protein